MLIYLHTKRAVEVKIAKLIAEGEMDSQDSECDEKVLYPVVLGTKASQQIYEEHNRINYYLSNVFTGTSNEKVVGGLELLLEKPKKKDKKDKDKDKEKGADKEQEKEVKKKKSDSSQYCLVNQIMQETGFKLKGKKDKDSSIKKQKTHKAEKGSNSKE